MYRVQGVQNYLEKTKKNKAPSLGPASSLFVFAKRESTRLSWRRSASLAARPWGWFDFTLGQPHYWCWCNDCCLCAVCHVQLELWVCDCWCFGLIDFKFWLDGHTGPTWPSSNQWAAAFHAYFYLEPSSILFPVSTSIPTARWWGHRHDSGDNSGGEASGAG